MRYSSLRKPFICVGSLMALYIVVSTFFLTWSPVEGDSMEHTIKDSSIVAIDNFTYGAVMPVRFSEIALVKYMFFALPPQLFHADQKLDWGYHRMPGVRLPQPGDVVVCVSPESPHPMVCKRVVASGGDTVCIRGGICYVNGLVSDFGPGIQPTHDEDTVRTTAFPPWQDWNKHNYGPIVIPVDIENPLYFVLGDNRAVSRDSRAWGFLDFKRIRGRIIILNQ